VWFGEEPGIWNPSNGAEPFKIQCQESCLSEISIQIIVIQVGLQYARQVYELLAFPLFKLYERFSQKNERRDSVDPLSMPQHILDQELEQWEQRDEMSSKIIQFGFIILFTAAFPLSPLFSLFNNLSELKVDMFRLLTQKRRPFAFRSDGNGIYNELLAFLVTLSSVTNGIIIAFNSRWFEDNFIPLFSNVDPLAVRVIFCIFFNYSVIATRFLVDVIVPDIPLNIKIAKKHREFCDRLENGEVVTDFDAPVGQPQENFPQFAQTLRREKEERRLP
jgi:hypothetical protein